MVHPSFNDYFPRFVSRLCCWFLLFLWDAAAGAMACDAIAPPLPVTTHHNVLSQFCRSTLSAYSYDSPHFVCLFFVCLSILVCLVLWTGPS